LVQETQQLVIYTHPDCDASAEAKADFQRDGIEFREIDITEEPGAMEELLKLTGGERITPVMVEGKLVTIGYMGIG